MGTTPLFSIYVYALLALRLFGVKSSPIWSPGGDCNEIGIRIHYCQDNTFANVVCKLSDNCVWVLNMINVVTSAGIPIWLYHLGYTNYIPDRNVLNVLIALGWKMNGYFLKELCKLIWYWRTRWNSTICCRKKWESRESFCTPRLLKMREYFKQYANHWHLVFGIDNVHLSNFSTATRNIMWSPILMMGTACGNDHLVNCNVVVRSTPTPDLCYCWKP